MRKCPGHPHERGSFHWSRKSSSYGWIQIQTDIRHWSNCINGISFHIISINRVGQLTVRRQSVRRSNRQEEKKKKKKPLCNEHLS